ncbi:MAG: ABC transporter ATP-binding protein [Candidatus Howiella sp.]|jgi:spermidine/putrescine transport system ATP-binding protein
MEPILSIENITKSFGENRVLDRLSLRVGRGRFVTLLGPSGCGKTTTIRIVAGLETPDAGRVLLNGEDVTALPPDKRRVNTVFQNYALFPHLDVYNNIAYGLKVRRLPRSEIRKKVSDILALVELPGFENRSPAELSGGQRQRVAIARALVLDPEILLLDEPLGALDLQLRRQMQRELKAIQLRLGITFIYITHDQEEAMSMSDDIILMQNGRIEQQGTPREIYEHPATEFAASFIGESNILHGTLSVGERGQAFLDTPGGKIPCAPPSVKQDGSAAVSIRPHDIAVSREGRDFALPGTVKHIQYTGSLVRLTVETEAGLLTAELDGHAAGFWQGDAVCLFWKPEHAAVIGDGASDRPD